MEERERDESIENSSKIKTKKQKKEEKKISLGQCHVPCDSQHTDVHGPLTRTRPRHEPIKLRMT
jgi:hypothetical protein